jgi:hypothetical protein
MDELDGWYEAMGEAEGELLAAQADFDEADEAIRRLLREAELTMSEYRKSRESRGLDV